MTMLHYLQILGAQLENCQAQVPNPLSLQVPNPDPNGDQE